MIAGIESVMIALSSLSPHGHALGVSTAGFSTSSIPTASSSPASCDSCTDDTTRIPRGLYRREMPQTCKPLCRSPSSLACGPAVRVPALIETAERAI